MRHPDLDAMARRVIDANHYMTLGTADPAGQGEAVYITATATAVPDGELEAVCPEAFRTRAGAGRFTPDDLRDGDLRLYVARMRSCEVHVAGHHPVHGRGTDTRQPADPTAARAT
jgi:hypothetical protein